METAETDRLGHASEDDRRIANLARLHTIFRAALLHELRAPLNAVSLNLDLLRQSLEEEASGEDQESRLEYVRRVRSAMEELEGALTAAVTIRGLIENEADDSDLVALVSDLHRTIRHEAFTRRIRLSWSAPGGATPVRGTASRLRQGLLNGALVVFDALPDGGEVVLSLKEEGSEPRFVLRGTGPAASLEPSDDRLDFIRSLWASEGATVEARLVSPECAELSFRFSGAR